MKRTLTYLVISLLAIMNLMSQTAFNGLEMNMGNLYRLSYAKPSSISLENFNGEKGKGGMARLEDKDKSNVANASNAAKDLGLFANVSMSNSMAQNLDKASFISLKGEVVSKGNSVEADGNLHEINNPLLRLMRTKVTSPKGTVLLLAGGGYEILKTKNEGEKAALFLSAEGFDVAMLEYHVSKAQNRNSWL